MSHSAFQGLAPRDEPAQHADDAAQAVRRELFLDLEDTIITPVVNGWGSFELINVEKVRAFIDAFEPTAVNIFSFAIWDLHQRELFNRLCRPHLEKALSITFNLTLTVDGDITPVCCRQMGVSPGLVDFNEMSAFWSKQGAFRLWCRHHATSLRLHEPNLHLHMVLLDDVVYNEVLRWPDLQTTVEQRNIDQL